jgi:hypothetical protein
MKEYPKIQSMYKRDEETHKFIEGQWSLPEFEYLSSNDWVWTEKVDGTNIRICWYPHVTIDVPTRIVPHLEIKGKTDRADIPKFLLKKLQEMFTMDLMLSIFPEKEVCLYGEGYGAKIQKKGSCYIPNGVSFVLFDVKVGYWWLKRIDIEGLAEKLGIKVVPIVGEGTLYEAINLVKIGVLSRWSEEGRCFDAEGLVLKPKIDLLARSGERIITKLKYKDFK